MILEMASLEPAIITFQDGFQPRNIMQDGERRTAENKLLMKDSLQKLDCRKQKPLSKKRTRAIGKENPSVR